MSQPSVLKETPYWTDPHPLQKSYAGKALSAQTDTLVIGGGFTGMVAALRLRQKGVQVTLVDREGMGWGASSRNGGMVLTGMKQTAMALVKMFGLEKGLQYFAISVDSIDSVENLVNEGNLDCDFRRCGHLAAAAKPSHLETMKRTREFLEKHLDYHTTLIPAAGMRAEIGSDYYHGGIVDPHSAGFHPAKFIAGLTGMADAAGVDLHDGVEVTGIARRGSDFAVVTNRGSLKAGQVLVATNGYTGGVTPWLQRRIIPINSYIIATEILPPEVAQALIPKGRMIFDTKNFLFYFRLSPDGKRMLFGGRAKFTATTLRQSAEIMRRSMIEVYPQLKDYRLEYAWSGRLGFTFDRFPHLGQHDGVFYALGYSGHGAAMGTYLGEKAAALMLGGSGSLLAERKFSTVPFYGGKPWFLPLVQLYFKAQDRLG